MGQKVNPNGLRLGVNKDWQSNWFADKDYAVKLNNDIKIREYLLKTLNDAALDLNTLKQTQRNFNSKDKILKALASRDISTLREISNYFYRTNGIYFRICNYFA